VYITYVTKIKHILAPLFSGLILIGFTGIPAFAKDDAAKNNEAQSKLKKSGYTQMTGEQLRAVFSDTTMIGEYREYRDVTRTYSYTEKHNADGTTDYIEGRKKEDGRWKIIGDDKICYKYPHSRYYTRTYCFFVYEVEGCYYKYSPDNMTLKRGPKNLDRWNSRAVRKGAGGTCGDALS